MNTYHQIISELNRFYRKLDFKAFKTITPERKIELDIIVSKWYSCYHENNNKSLLFMAHIAKSLSLEQEPFGLKNGDE